jgi:PAS domain-containing protein
MTFANDPFSHAALGRLESYFDHAQVGLHMVGGDGVIIRANRADCAPINVPHADYVGRSITDFHADQAVIGHMLERLLGDRPLINYAARLKGRDAVEAPVVICSNSRWRDGAFVNTRCYTRTADTRPPLMPDRIDKPETISDRRERFTTLSDFFEQSIPGVCAIGPDACLTAVNRTLSANLGMTPGEILSRRLADLMADERGLAAIDDLRRGTSLVDRTVALRGMGQPLKRRLYVTAEMRDGSFFGACLFLFDPEASDQDTDVFSWPAGES